jgi:hypothetical protein
MASTRQQVTGLIRDRFDTDRAEEILGDEAFGALVYRVREYCDSTGSNPVAAFDALPDDDVEFALRTRITQRRTSQRESGTCSMWG